MIDVFNLKPEIPAKKRIISQFSEWWPDDEIRQNVIPNIVEKNLKDSIDGALHNFDNTDTSNKKSFAEILYDLVGQNFLVNQNSVIRGKFLEIILKKKLEEDSSFQERFLAYLLKQIKSTSDGKCEICNKRWVVSDNVYYQRLGLSKKPICCSDYQCALKQQKSKIPKISEPLFHEFISKFKLKREYKNFCRKLVEEFKFPNDVIFQPNKEIKLLPETIKPLGMFSTLYDFQSSIGLKIIDMLENYEKSTSRALVVLPTGAGKTRLVVESLIEWINNGKKGKEESKFVLWIVDKNELCQQTFDTFAEIFRYRGRRDSSLKLHPIYGENNKNIGDILYQYSEEKCGDIHEENGVVIASIQSLYRISENKDCDSLSELGKYTSIVVIDEAHHAVSSNKSYTQVLKVLGFNFKNSTKKGVDINENHTCLLGLTATPFRGTDELGKSTRDLLNRFGTKKRILWPAFSDEIANENIPPHAHVEVQKTAFQFERVKLYGERSYDKDGKIKKYRFMIQKLLSTSTHSTNPVISDKTYDEQNIDFEFKEPGKYLITLTVMDDEGTTNQNLATANIDIYPIKQQEEKTNVEEMKKLYRHLIKREILSRPHHYIIDNTKAVYDATGDIEQYNTFHEVSDATIRSIGKDSHRNHKIIEKIISLVKKENRQSILLFACSIEHSKLLSFILDAIYDIKSASIDHTVSTDERDKSIHDFRQGKISVLCNYDILTTGFDSPKVECVFVTRPTFSHLLYNQMTGRGLRGPRSSGTTDCIIVDISDNIQLSVNQEIIEQPWNIFDYIYETLYDERDETKMKQTCYGCFGVGKRQFKTESQDCQICNGSGIILPKKETNISDDDDIKKDKEKLQRLQKEIFRKHSNWSLKQINDHAKKLLKYDTLLESQNTKRKPKNEWEASCKKCNKRSNDMPKTLSQFGKSTELISNDNPQGIFDVCRECRGND